MESPFCRAGEPMRSTRSHFWNSSAKSCRFLIPQLNISKQYQCREPCFAWLIGHLSRGPEIISLRSITAAKKKLATQPHQKLQLFFPIPIFFIVHTVHTVTVHTHPTNVSMASIPPPRCTRASTRSSTSRSSRPRCLGRKFVPRNPPHVALVPDSAERSQRDS